MQLELFVDSLDTVVRRLRLASALRGPVSGELGGLERGVEPAGFLASLIDFRGGIALDAALRARAAASPLPAEPEAATEDAVPPWPAEPQALTVRTRAALTEVDRLLQQQLQGAGVEGLLSPLRLHRVLQARGPLDPAQVDRLAAPFDLRLRQALLLVPREIAQVRRPLGRVLQGLGPGPARLERLDAALHAATRSELQRLQDRLVVAYHAAFVRALQLAHSAGPSTAVEAQTAAFAAGGWVMTHFELGQQVAQAVLALARARVLALLRGALPLIATQDQRETVDGPSPVQA